MDCPNCGKQMSPGVLRMIKPILEWFAFGLGTRNLYFEREGTDKDELVFHWSKKARAFRCGDCRTVVFPESK